MRPHEPEGDLEARAACNGLEAMWPEAAIRRVNVLLDARGRPVASSRRHNYNLQLVDVSTYTLTYVLRVPSACVVNTTV